MDDQIWSLTRRVFELERQVTELRAQLGMPAQAPPQPPPPQPSGEMQPAAAVVAPTAPPRVSTTSSATDEANLVGTWFARLGAIAILLGAGFGFKYAVDRGVIGPAARFSIGLAVGSIMSLAAEWAHRRTWSNFSQALGGGGFALLYLSLWAGFDRYHLIDAGTTLTLLSILVATTFSLAAWRRTRSLAVIATIGGLLNPLLVHGASHPVAFLAYIAVLDAAVLTLAWFRRWPEVDHLAFLGSVAIFSSRIVTGSFGSSFAAASTLFAIFTLVPMIVGSRETDDNTVVEGAAISVRNGIAYFAAGMFVLTRHDHESARGAFALLLASAYLLLAYAPMPEGQGARTRRAILSIASVVLLTIAMPLQFDGLTVIVAWTIEGAALVAAGVAGAGSGVGIAGVIVLGLGVFGSAFDMFALGEDYHPARFMFSRESGILVLQIAALAGAAAAFARRGPRDLFRILVVAANGLAVAWMSFEAAAHFRGTEGFLGSIHVGRRQALQFSLSAIWGLYAGALLIVGVAARSKLSRSMAVALFGVTIVKIVLVDVWTLSTLYRTITFAGIGVVLLLCSLMYQRFRDILIAEDEPTIDSTV